jgi:general secretion pathway protein B
MSYILDALKKSDKQRPQTRVPDLNTVPLELPPQKRKKASWLLPMAALVLVNVLVIVFFVMRQNQPAPEKRASVGSPEQAHQKTVQEEKKTPAPQAAPALAPASPEPLQSETAAAGEESPGAGMAKEDMASGQEPAAALPEPQEERAAASQPRQDVSTGDTGEPGPEAANDTAPQAAPALAPASPEPLQSETAAAGEESPGADMAEEDMASGQEPAAALPEAQEERAAASQPQEDVSTEDTGEPGPEAADDTASPEDVAGAGDSASPAKAASPAGSSEKAQPGLVQRPRRGETADAGPQEPDAGFMKKALHIDQLPSSVRQQLPDIHIGAHLFYKDKPASRFAYINGKMLREGQMLAPDIKVAEISTDGVIFRHQKYLFYVPVF